MYNRYIPQDEHYDWVRAESTQDHPQGKVSQPHKIVFPPFLNGQEGLSALFSPKEGKGGLAGLFKTLHLENLDTGDVLLLLIILYLLVEGDDLDLVIALGLVLIMGLGEDKEH